MTTPSRRTFLAALGGTVLGGAAVVGSDRLDEDGGTSDGCPEAASPYWQYRAGSLAAPWSAPAVGADAVVAAEGYGIDASGIAGEDEPLFRLVALDAGDVRWARTVPNYGWGRPRVADGVVYVGTGAAGLHAYDLESGERLFRTDEDTDGPTRSSAWGRPLVTGSLAVVGYDGGVLAVDRETGELAWDRDRSTAYVVGPATLEGQIVLGGRDGRVEALSRSDGTSLWTEGVEGSTNARLQRLDGTVVVSHGYVEPSVSDRPAVGGVTAFGPDGGPRWSTVGGDVVAVNAVDAVAGDPVVATEDGTVARLAVADGSVRWRETVDAPVGALATDERTVYAFDHGGRVSAFGYGAGEDGGELTVAATERDDCTWSVEDRNAHALATGIAGGLFVVGQQSFGFYSTPEPDSDP